MADEPAPIPPDLDGALREVVVPLDGSTFAASAFEPAHAIARATDAWLRLVTTSWDHEVDQARTHLRRLASRAEVPVETEVILDRDPVRTIVMHAKHHDSLVCMATHGRRGIGQAVLGSVTAEVLRAVSRPVLLVGPRLSTRLSALEPPNLLVGIEPDDASDAVVGAVATWAGALHLVTRVVQVAVPSLVGARSGKTDAASANVDGAVKRLTDLGIDAHGCVVHGSDAAANLLDEATTWPATMLVVGTHARAGVGGLALGSVAMKVVHTSPCPVLVVPPGASASGDRTRR